MTGGFYAVVAIAAGLGLLCCGARMARKRNLASAHALLLATVFYLPTLLGVMVVDRKPVHSVSIWNSALPYRITNWRKL
jgi:heme O synthase-like polyprenyltransferase